MKHYHGTPCSGSEVDAAQFLSGRHALIPFAYPNHLGVAMDVCQSFVLDNSAFTYWRAGKGRVDKGAYWEWVRRIYQHPAFDWCLIPDIIDGAEAENQDLVNWWLREGRRVKGVPVWHLHESLEWLEWLADRFEIVALGSSGQWATPGTDGWWKRMAEAMAVACDAEGRPRCKLHGLRMLDPAIFSRLPLASADSTNAAVNAGSVARFGMYPAPSAGTRAAVIADRIEAIQPPSVWVPLAQNADLWEVA